MQHLDRRPRPRPRGQVDITSGGPPAPQSPVPGAPFRRAGVALPLLASAQLMLVLDVTVVNVALPDIGAALHLHRDELRRHPSPTVGVYTIGASSSR
jgi:hypothetical protein